jgi:hypothetical protein
MNERIRILVLLLLRNRKPHCDLVCRSKPSVGPCFLPWKWKAPSSRPTGTNTSYLDHVARHVHHSSVKICPDIQHPRPTFKIGWAVCPPRAKVAEPNWRISLWVTATPIRPHVTTFCPSTSRVCTSLVYTIGGQCVRCAASNLIFAGFRRLLLLSSRHSRKTASDGVGV